ncbi:MAG TPA: DUF3794 domain-containing protein [Symbiobacteriaceae bacterium]|nr:DUF3794 domain-containing protein [Symbiobacteriaceae bacterium]
MADQCTQLLKLDCLVCESTGEACVESRFVLPRRAKKIAEIQARVVDLEAEVIDCQVMVSGTLHKQVFFVGEDHHVHHVPEDVPFTVFIDCPGAVTGQNAQVTARIVKLSHSLEFCQELVQRAVLQFVVRVTEDCQVNAILDSEGPLVKAECVVGETTKAVTVENCVDLERRAKKIRDVQVALEHVFAEASDGQVHLQGVIVKSIFYISEDDVEFYQEERVPFSAMVEVAGAEPGDNVSLKAQILRVDRFLSNGRQVRQRIVLSVFVKVTRTCELNVAEDVNGPQVMASRVISTNSRQILVENAADLNRPARKIQEIQARVEDVSVETIPNKVIITGTLHKQIFFVADDDLVRHMGEDIPFTTFVDLPGIKPGDSVNISPIVEHVGFELTDAIGDDSTTDCSCDDESGTTSRFDDCDPYVEEPESPIFRRLIQRTVIQLIVRGSEEQAIRLATAPLPATVTLGTSC